MKEIRETVDILRVLKGYDLESFEIESRGTKIRLAKASAPAAAPAAVRPAEVAQPTSSEPAPSREAQPAPEPAADLDASYESIRSPMVGTFYGATEPGRPPLVSVGQVVTPGEPVCIIEAMKLMNVIKSDLHGKVVKILVENAQPVQAGQVLFLVDTKQTS